MFMLNLVGHLILISFLMKLSPFKMMSAIKSGVVSHSRFAKMAERDFKVSPLSLSFVSSFLSILKQNVILKAKSFYLITIYAVDTVSVCETESQQQKWPEWE